jgi:cytochrome P450
MLALLQNSDQFTQMQQDPGLRPNAVEEMLRYDPPVQMMARFAKEDIDPDTFDIHRKNPNHVSFGYGIHLYLGLELARLEAKVAIDALLVKYPDMTLAEQEVDWQTGFMVRGMEHLFVETGR